VTTTVKASENAALAQELANKAMQEPTQVTVGVPEAPKPAPLPPDTTVTLAAGLLDVMTGECEMTAEVRELTGADEEALARIVDPGKSLLATLDRAVVKIGDKPAKKEDLDVLLAGDRELLLMAIRTATFGAEVKLEGACPLCSADDQTFIIDLNKDVKVVRLDNPADRNFMLDCKAGEVEVTLPDGTAQKKLVAAQDKTQAELDTILLKSCIAAINGMPIFDVKQIQGLGMADRRKIIGEIVKRSPGPRLAEIEKTCSACGQEVPLPLTLAELFRV
jgi:dsDNA-binding SOS-regulon protein